MQSKNRVLFIISIIVLIVDVVTLAILIRISYSFLQLFKGFNISLPLVTKIAIYFAPYIYIAGILFLIIKELLLKKKGVAFIINILAFFIMIVLIMFNVIALFLPAHKLEQIAPSSSAEDESFDKGIDYLQEGAYDKALIEFNKVIEINPMLWRAYSYRGSIYVKKDEFVKAIADYTKAIEINPNDAKNYGNRGAVYSYMKEYDKAWADVHKAETLGLNLGSEFIDALKKASGREK